MWRKLRSAFNENRLDLNFKMHVLWTWSKMIFDTSNRYSTPFPSQNKFILSQFSLISKKISSLDQNAFNKKKVKLLLNWLKCDLDIGRKSSFSKNTVVNIKLRPCGKQKKIIENKNKTGKNQSKQNYHKEKRMKVNGFV